MADLNLNQLFSRQLTPYAAHAPNLNYSGGAGDPYAAAKEQRAEEAAARDEEAFKLSQIGAQQQIDINKTTLAQKGREEDDEVAVRQIIAESTMQSEQGDSEIDWRKADELARKSGRYHHYTKIKSDIRTAELTEDFNVNKLNNDNFVTASNNMSAGMSLALSGAVTQGQELWRAGSGLLGQQTDLVLVDKRNQIFEIRSPNGKKERVSMLDFQKGLTSAANQAQHIFNMETTRLSAALQKEGGKLTEQQVKQLALAKYSAGKMYIQQGKSVPEELQLLPGEIPLLSDSLGMLSQQNMATIIAANPGMMEGLTGTGEEKVAKIMAQMNATNTKSIRGILPKNMVHKSAWADLGYPAYDLTGKQALVKYMKENNIADIKKVSPSELSKINKYIEQMSGEKDLLEMRQKATK